MGIAEILPSGQDDDVEVNAITSIQGQVYTDRAAFDAALDGVANISFEGFATGGGQANAVELDGDEFPGLTLTAGAGTTGLYVGIPDQSIAGGNDQSFFAGDFVPTSGDAVLATDLTGYADGAIIVDFDTPTDGVGASFLDVEARVSYVEAFDGPGGTGNSLGKGTLTNQGNVSQSFVGVAAEGIQSAVLQIGGSNDGVGLDDLRYGSPGGVVDDEAPAAVDDLAARPGQEPGSIELSWTATGDDGHSGTASGYMLRYNSEPISEDNWTACTDVPGEPAPSVAGSAESMTLSGLVEGQTYHFAIKVRDKVPYLSDLSNNANAIAPLTPVQSWAVTGMDGKATLTIDGQEVTFEPFDPEMPGLPLPQIKITAKEYTTHTILFWEDTIGDRPPPYYRPALDLLAKPLNFAEDQRPLQPVPQPSYQAYLPHVVKNSAPARSLAVRSTPSAIHADEQAEGWDIGETKTVPNTITAYDGPDATIDGSDFADTMIDRYPDAKAFVFYHRDPVPSIDDAEMDIYETIDDRVIVIYLRQKDTEPADYAEIAATEIVWHVAFEKISLKDLDLISTPVTFAVEKSFEHYNSQCIPIPDVTGKDRSEARNLLQQMGFVVEEAETYWHSPLDEVIDQSRGPDAPLAATCGLPGAKVVIEISLGPKPWTYELYSLTTRDDSKDPKALFEPGDTVGLWLLGANHSGETLPVSYSWQTTDPLGQPVGTLSLSGHVVQVPGYERSDPKLKGPAPNLCGEYTVAGTASFTLEGTQQTLKRLAYFSVAGGGCIIPDHNRSPYVPSNPSPADGTTGQGLNLTLSWTGGDPDSDNVSYDVFWGTSNPPVTQIGFSQSKTTKATGPIKTNTTYYWQVVAKDEEGKTTSGPVWSFATGAGWSPPGEVVYVPAGAFQMGCDPTNTAETCRYDEELHSAFLSGYYIDKHEVTNSQYAQCVNAGACSPPAQSDSSTRPVYYGSSLFAEYPVTYVSWQQASDYCAWVGMRLPTEAEWEKAARGKDDTRAYPWGNTAPDCSRLNFAPSDYAGPCEGDTKPVGSYPTGQSPNGVLDMAGNVWEWVNDWYDSGYYGVSPYTDPQGPDSGQVRSARGGSWRSYPVDVSVSERGPLGADKQYNWVGFRCAR